MPLAEAYVPAGHLLQDVLEPSPYVPGEHDSHAVLNPSIRNVPGPQQILLSKPVHLWNVLFVRQGVEAKQ